MICPQCRDANHAECPGKGQCDCQHRGPSRACGGGVWVIRDGKDEVMVCGQTPARLYACGWRCEDCAP